MPAAGVVRRDFLGLNKPAANSNMLAKPTSMSFRQAYPASVEQTGQDYSRIMEGYEELLSKIPGRFSGLRSNVTSGGGQPLSFKPITPQAFSYNRSPEVTEGFSKLRGLTETGGYAPEEIASLRERSISPIRSVYANAQRNMDRQKVLSGGYSPNYNAASSRMTRDLSEQIAGATTNVNAAIAERVAAGRQSAIPQFAQQAASESELSNRITQMSTDARNRASEINSGRKLEVDRLNLEGKNKTSSDLERLAQEEQAAELQALESMRSLYGTTPALASLFGQQALGAEQIQQQANQGVRQTGLGLVGQYMNRPQPMPQIRSAAIPGKKTVAPPMRVGFRNQRLGGG